MLAYTTIHICKCAFTRMLHSRVHEFGQYAKRESAHFDWLGQKWPVMVNMKSWLGSGHSSQKRLFNTGVLKHFIRPELQEGSIVYNCFVRLIGNDNELSLLLSIFKTYTNFQNVSAVDTVMFDLAFVRNNNSVRAGRSFAWAGLL